MTATVAELLRALRILAAYMRVTLKDAVRYRWDALIKLVGYPFRILMVVFLWQTLFTGGLIEGRSLADVISYYVLAFLFTTMYPFVRSAREIRDEVFDGSVAMYFVRGVPHWTVHAARFLTNAGIHLLLTVPVVATVLALFGALDLSLASGIQFLAFLVIKALIWYAIGVAAFFLEETLGLIRIVSLAEEFLSGALLPLYFFPATLATIAAFLPFQFTLYAPIDALTSPLTWPEFAGTLLLGATWIVALVAFVAFLLRAGMRRFTMHGA